MRLFPIYIFSIVLSFIFTACQKTNDTPDYERIVTQAESLIDSRPDSVITLLRNINLNSINDIALSAKAHYLYGVSKESMLDFQSAIHELLYAEKFAEIAKDYPLLIDARKHIMNIYDYLHGNKGAAEYAVKIADAYELIQIPDSSLCMLDDAIVRYAKLGMHTELPTLYSRMENMKESCTDSMRDYRLIFAKSYILQPDIFKHIDDNESLLRDSISHGGDWRKLITCDTLTFMPGHIYSISSDLWREGNDSIAKQLIEYYCEYYACKEFTGGDYSILTLTKVFKTPFTVNGMILDRRAFFKKYLPLVEREAVEFYYKENVIKEQAMRYQRTKTTAIILCSGLLICLLAMSLFIVRSRKRRIEEESMRSVIELKSALSQSKDRWLSTLGQLCNTYYSAYAKTATRSRTAQEALAEIESATASPTFFPELEARLNSENDNLMARFRTAMPDLRPDEYHLFLLNALGFSIPTISLLLKEKREVIYNRRQRLRSKIQESDIPGRDLFLDYLE